MSAIGIDFGTTQSCIAVARRGGVDILCNEVSNRFTPSIVVFSQKSRSIGEAGATLEVSNLKNAVRSLKRLLGRTLDDPVVQAEQQHLTCQLCQVGNEVGVMVDYLGAKCAYSATQLCAMYLAQLKAVAEKETNAPCKDVVVGVPIWFTPRQRRALQNACHIAGLNLLRAFNENTAAALTYGITKTEITSENPRKVVFIDVGHSSTTVTAAVFSKGSLEIKGTSFDALLGGRDFDQKLCDHFVAEIKTKHGVDISQMQKPMFRLRAGVEKLRKTLSSNVDAMLNIESLTPEIDLNMMFTREKFEGLVEPLLSRFSTLLQRALYRANWTPDEVMFVESVGGASRIPAVRGVIAEFFNRPDVLSFTVNQDEVIARGCALMSAIISPVFRVREYNVKDLATCAFNLRYQPDSMYGTLNEHGQPATKTMTVFDINSEVPSSKVITLSTARQEMYFESVVDASEGSPVYKFWPDQVPLEAFRITNIPSNQFIPSPTGEPVAAKPTQLKARVRYYPDHTFHVDSVQATYEVVVKESAKQPQKEAAAAAAATSNVTADTAEDQSSVAAEPVAADAATPVQPLPKLESRVIELPVNASMFGDHSADDLQALCESEQSMANHDKLVRETEAARNSLEEYIYAVYDKADSQWRAYLEPSQHATLTAAAKANEEWLYSDEGETATIAEYNAKLNEMTAIGQPAAHRLMEASNREHTVERFRAAANGCLQQITQSCPGWIPKADVEALHNQITASCQRVESLVEAQKHVLAHAQPAFLNAEVDFERTTIETATATLMSRPKPNTPVQPPAAACKDDSSPCCDDEACCDSRTQSDCCKNNPQPDQEVNEEEPVAAN